jgi:hypothetical protein
MCESVGLELLRHELDAWGFLGSDAASPRAHPRLPDERTHLLQSMIIEVAGDEFFMCTLDQQTRGLRRTIT